MALSNIRSSLRIQQPRIQQGPDVVIPQHMPPTFCQVNRYAHSLSECLDVVGHALPVSGAYVNLRVERAGHKALFGELAQASVVWQCLCVRGCGTSAAN